MCKDNKKKNYFNQFLPQKILSIIIYNYKLLTHLK